MATEGNQRRGACEGCDFTEITYFCDTCPAYLCSRCAESHKRFNATKSHLLRTLDVTEAPRSSEPVPAYCPVHPADQLTSYCDSCDDILCIQCHRSSHSNHTVTSISKSKNKMQKLCITFLSKLFDTTTTLQTDDKDGTALKDTHIAALQKVKKELLERKSELQTCIETSYKHSVTEVDAEISRVRSDFDRFASQKKESMSHAEQLDAKLVSVRRNDDVDFLVDALRECKVVYPKVQKMAGLKAESFITFQPEKMLASRDEVGKVKSSMVKVLSITKQQKNKIDTHKIIQCDEAGQAKSAVVKSVSVTKPEKNKTVTDTVNQPVSQKMRPMLFHTTHGSNIQLSADRRQATRVNWVDNGICFGDRPVVINEKIYIKITDFNRGFYHKSSIGFSSHDPNTLDGTTLPGDASALKNEPSFWVTLLLQKYPLNTILHIYVTPTGAVRYGVNGDEKGELLSGVNTDVPVWLLLDIKGRISSMTCVDGK